MIIRTHPYSRTEIADIISVRSKTEGLAMSPAAISALAKIGAKTSLRYVMQLLTPASIVADMNGSAQIEEEHIQEVYETFLDSYRSTEKLKENAEGYLK